MAATYVKYQDFVEQLGLEQHNLNTDTLCIALTNTTPVVTHTTLSDITEIADGNGYSTGTHSVANSAYTESSGTGTLVGDKVTITASGGAIAQFRYAVLYNNSNATDMLICYWDYGSAVDLADGETFTVQFGGQDSGGTILTIT